MAEKTENEQIREEMDQVIDDLKKNGVKHNSEVIGLGDIVEKTLDKFGITQERFKRWMNLEECRCTERKKWLNNLFSIKMKK